MTDAQESHEGSISIISRVITNLQFTYDIDSLRGIEVEMANLDHDQL